ncbi:MAG: sulfatase-like hydrolase/transferase [Rikenellaceae bacterium]
MRLKQLALIAPAAAAVGCSANTPEPTKPNVVVLYIDDLDFEELGYCGGAVYTPFIDSLASQSLKLSNFYVAAPVSTPSRYSGLTGRYASHSNSFVGQPKCDPAYVRWNADIVKGKDKTIATYLREANYRSGFVGKWHNGQPMPEEELLAINMETPNLTEVMAANYRLQRQHVHTNSDFDYAESIYANNLHAVGLPKEMQQHNMEWITKGAVDFLDSCTGDEPFFLWFSTTVPHEPNPIKSLTGDARITAGGLMDAPIEGVQPSRESVLERTRARGIADKHASLLWLDDGIRALFNKMEAQGVLDNTLVIFASDNGESKGKMTCYQAAAHLPAFVYWRGKIMPATCDELTSNLDFLPTIMELSGLDSSECKLDGESWVDMIFNGGKLSREAICTEVVYQRAVITKEWKYVATRFTPEVTKSITPENRTDYSIEGMVAKDRYHNQNFYPAYYDNDQLYNIKDDYAEQKNLYNDPQYSEQAAQMRALMTKFIATLPYDFGEYKSEL